MKKSMLILGSVKIDLISISGIYGTYRDLHLTEKEHKKKLFQGWYSNKIAFKKTFGQILTFLLDYDFSKHPVYPYGFKEDLIVSLQFNYSEKVIFSNRDSAAAYKLSDISLEYDATSDENYVTTIEELYAGTASVSYTKVTLIHYHT